MEREGDLHLPGEDPGPAEVAVDGDRRRPLGAVEAGRDGGRAVVDGLRAHSLSDQVGTHDSVGREQQQQGREIPASGRSEEGVDDAAALVARGLRLGRLRCTFHLPPRPARQLAYGSTRAPQDGADLIERIPEDIVQDERRSLRRRQCVEDDLHCPAHPLGEQDAGLGVDRCGIGGCLGLGLRPGTSLAQVVQAQPRHDGRQPGGQVVDVVGAGEPQPGLLQHVVRIGLRAEYPAGDRGQPGALGVEVDHVHCHILQHVHRGHILLTCAAAGM